VTVRSTVNVGWRKILKKFQENLPRLFNPPRYWRSFWKFGDLSPNSLCIQGKKNNCLTRLNKEESTYMSDRSGSINILVNLFFFEKINFQYILFFFVYKKIEMIFYIFSQLFLSLSKSSSPGLGGRSVTVFSMQARWAGAMVISSNIYNNNLFNYIIRKIIYERIKGTF
jgi:hypothetical protein